jgi:hypothetical protein
MSQKSGPNNQKQQNDPSTFHGIYSQKANIKNLMEFFNNRRGHRGHRAKDKKDRSS